MAELFRNISYANGLGVLWGYGTRDELEAAGADQLGSYIQASRLISPSLDYPLVLT